ncbi:MAG: hypothetical protein H7210_06185 [Pyrinomonadaceae bacterium]|nr:hypothetical protein [Phycisphaerales bacterium]
MKQKPVSPEARRPAASRAPKRAPAPARQSATSGTRGSAKTKRQTPKVGRPALARSAAKESVAARKKSPARPARPPQPKDKHHAVPGAPRRDLRDVLAAPTSLATSRPDHPRPLSSTVRDTRKAAKLADELFSDLASAMEHRKRRQRRVRIGRALATTAGVLSLLGRRGWTNVAFTSLAIGMRIISSEYSQSARMRAYQSKWNVELSKFSADQMTLFTSIFARKYPAMASMISELRRRAA